MTRIMWLLVLASAQVWAGSTVTVLPNSGGLVRPGFTFNGWNTSASGSGTAYQPGATFEIGNSNITLYAQWQAIPAISYTVAYAANGATGGAVPIDPNTYTPATSPPPNTCNPGEVWAAPDIDNPLNSFGTLFPGNPLVASGDFGRSVRFVANAGNLPNGVQLVLQDEAGSGAKDAVISACPHSFVPVNANPGCSISGIDLNATFLMRFGAQVDRIECAVPDGGTYYLNYRATNQPRGNVSTKFQNYPR